MLQGHEMCIEEVMLMTSILPVYVCRLSLPSPGDHTLTVSSTDPVMSVLAGVQVAVQMPSS